MKRKWMIGITAAVMMLTMTIGGTLAYFTDKDEAVNVITMGKIQIDLDEKMVDPESGEEVPYVDPVNVKPGDEVSKIPYVSNIDDRNACYIRVKLDIFNPEGASDVLLDIDALNIDTSKWDIVAITDSSFYCYYKEVLAAGEVADALFTEVSIPEKWGNEVAEQSFSIALTAEGIQADNFTPAEDAEGKIVGWLYSDGTEITPENYVAP